MKRILILACLLLVTNVDAAPLKKIAQSTGIDIGAVKTAHKAGVQLNLDELKDRVEASASDIDFMFAAVNGFETKTLEMQWTSGVQGIRMVAINRTLTGDPMFAETAEIYIGKEMVFEIDDSHQSKIGKWNDAAGTHENLDYITESISVETAEAISKANPGDITIRFYGVGGYRDQKPHKRSFKRFGALVALVKASQINR